MISFVTITFNNSQECIETVSSLLPLTALLSQPYESIVQNGGRSIEFPENLRNFAGFRVNQEKDDGIADAFNRGLKSASQPYVCFINSGDKIIDPDYYRLAVEYLEKHPNEDFCYGKINFLDSIHGSVILGKATQQIGSGMPFLHPTLVVRRKVFEETGGFESAYKIAMDYDWACRLIRKRKQGHFINRIAVQMDGGGVSSAREWQSIRESGRALYLNHLWFGPQGVFYLARLGRFLLRKLMPISWVGCLKKINSK